MTDDGRWNDLFKRLHGLWPSIAALTATMLGSLFFLVGSFQQRDRQVNDRTTAKIEADYLTRLEGAETQISLMQTELANAKAASRELQYSLLEAARKKGVVQYSQGLSTPDRQALDTVVASQANLDKRFSALEASLSQSPEKAVALPLLKQQITDMQEKDRGDLDNVHGEIGRLYTMMQWFLGLMLTLIIGVGGLIVNNLKRRV
jgi:hypothetical protein